MHSALLKKLDAGLCGAAYPIKFRLGRRGDRYRSANALARMLVACRRLCDGDRRGPRRDSAHQPRNAMSILPAAAARGQTTSEAGTAAESVELAHVVCLPRVRPWKAAGRK